ncbi:MAG TPA: acyl carrier protein [Nocardioides sp.]|uniref:acyl carrier protein n=1 Tax=Nocardioides sp. TaxID=35761 RepID=UPI002BDE7AD7|nr:acyl carrier protein [Nocardioides sp.]HTW16409.1 acyl carrier protein [Nocardioides sp.]
MSHPLTTTDLVPQVRSLLVRVLGIEEREHLLDASTPLLGELPELDSLAVVELAVALEEEFDIVVDDADVTGELFATVGSLAEYVADRAGSA